MMAMAASHASYLQGLSPGDIVVGLQQLGVSGKELHGMSQSVSSWSQNAAGRQSVRRGKQTGKGSVEAQQAVVTCV